MQGDHRRGGLASVGGLERRTAAADLNLIRPSRRRDRVDDVRPNRTGANEERPVIVNQGDGELPARQRRGQASGATEAHQEARQKGLITDGRRAMHREQTTKTLSECFSPVVGMGNQAAAKALKTLEQVKGIKPSYSA